MISMEKTSFKENLRTALIAGAIIGAFIGLFGGSIFSGLSIGLIVGSVNCLMFRKEEGDSPIVGFFAGSVFGTGGGFFMGSFLAEMTGNTAFTLIGILAGGSAGGYAIFIKNYKNKKLRIQYENQVIENTNNIEIYVDSHRPLKFGVKNPLKITVNNKTQTIISNIHLKTNFPKSVICNESIISIDKISAGLTEFRTILIIPTIADKIDLANLEITLEINKNIYKKEPVEIGIFDVNPPEIDIQIDVPNPLKAAIENPVEITVNNQSDVSISNVHLIPKLSNFAICNETIILIDEVPAGSSESKTLLVTPTITNEIDMGYLEMTLEINGKRYEKYPVEIGIFDVMPLEIDIQIDMPNPLKVGIENPIKITVNNQSNVLLSSVQIKTNFSRLIMCNESIVHTDDIPANSSEYTVIFITPRIADKINFGDLNLSYDINGNAYENKPISIGTYEAIEVNSHKETHADSVNSNISITRETEFYQGYIRLKMSITNPSSLVVNDVALDFDYDDKLLRMDIENQKYAIKNGKIILGNISSNSSTSVEVYFDPMMCSKGTDINCQVNYKDAKGQLQTSWMKPKKISVVCPIMETESDINIGRLKEFIEKLTCQDSKVYQIQNDFNIDVLKNTSREVIEKHDMKHIRTFSTKDGKMCEIWYYGKTKINNFDIVIKITISIETQSIELFAATQTKESLVGLLAEFGRELKNSIESNVTGNVKQIINVSIIDSIVQRSNLLSYCDFDGNCSGDVVIDGSYVQRSNINNNLELNLENKEGVNKMDMLDVYKYLVSIVEKSSNVEDIKIDYKDVWTHFNQDVKIMLPLFNMLNQICNKCRDENKPLLSAIVINEDNGIPGPGFFKHCIKYLDTYDELKTKKIHENELERVFNYWNKDKK